MAYDSSLSMANIVNIVEALNEGGMMSCEDLMVRIWNNATIEQVARKVNAPRRVILHTEDYARQQVKQEIRRTLYSYFNDMGRGYLIRRATALGDSERFWVDEPQDPNAERIVTVDYTPSANIMDAISPCSVPVSLYSNHLNNIDADLNDIITNLVGTV